MAAGVVLPWRTVAQTMDSTRVNSSSPVSTMPCLTSASRLMDGVFTACSPFESSYAWRDFLVFKSPADPKSVGSAYVTVQGTFSVHLHRFSRYQMGSHFCPLGIGNGLEESYLICFQSILLAAIAYVPNELSANRFHAPDPVGVIHHHGPGGMVIAGHDEMSFFLGVRQFNHFLSPLEFPVCVVPRPPRSPRPRLARRSVLSIHPSRH